MLHRACPRLLLGLALLAAVPARATLYVMVPDEDLVDGATVIVEGRVLAVEAAENGGRPATDYSVEVRHLLKGEAPEGRLVVRVPGGEGPDGLSLRVLGAPTFQVGARPLLFLVPGEPGTYRVEHLMLGAFHRLDLEGTELAVRDLSEAVEVANPWAGEPATLEHLPRDYGRFSAWIAERVAGRLREPDYRVELTTAQHHQLAHRFTLIRGRDTGLGVRFFEFDTGRQVDWYIHQGGQTGLPGGGTAEFRRAINLWNGESRTPINLVLRSTTSAGAGFSGFDGVNTLLFGDPNNNIGRPYDCRPFPFGGGILAVASPWWYPGERRRFRGVEYHPAVGADIITNRNLECFLTARACTPSKPAEAIFAHELGHTLGLGHSCDGLANRCDTPTEIEALMAPFIHDECRGPRLTVDDLRGIRSLYEQPAAPPVPPAAPSSLAAETTAPGEAVLTWSDGSTNESDFEIQARAVARSGAGTFDYLASPFTTLATVAANSTGHTALGLDPDTTYNVRVRARNTAGNSAFTAEATVTTVGPAAPGPCTPGPTTLCLLAARFRVEGFWNNFRVPDAHGDAMAVAGSDQSGFFWFFSAANTELVVKMVDAAALGGGFWYFSGALSDVEYWVVVTDTLTGHRKTYYNAPQNICGVGDTGALPQISQGPGPAVGLRRRAGWVGLPSAEAGQVVAGTCVPGPQTLCLAGNRFAVEVDWRNQHAGGTTGRGGAVPGTASDQTGFFWFFNPNNIELVAKVLDGTALNGHFWFFFGALSDVEYDIRVTDTVTGAGVTYHNQPGNICGGSDVEAFDG